MSCRTSMDKEAVMMDKAVLAANVIGGSHYLLARPRLLLTMLDVMERIERQRKLDPDDKEYHDAT